MTEIEIKESKEWLQDFIRAFGCNFDDLETRSFNEIVVYLEELQQYRAIGTIDELQALKEKTIAEKPLIVPIDDTCLHQEYRCPSCNEWLADILKPYRCKCGKLLDWQ